MHIWPLALLLAALATAGVHFIDSGPFERLFRVYDPIGLDHLAVAKNLAAEHGWLGLHFRIVEDGGEVVYAPHNSFPPLGHGLIKLATLTQPGDLRGQMQAARMLMLAFCAGAAVLAYFSLAHLTRRRWLALAATLAAFSSYAVLYSWDLVATEGAVDLFATMLAFHGIARYHRRGGAGAPRFGQLVAETFAALLLGWHAYALLAPFLALGVAAAIAGRDWAELRRLALFGALALLFGLAVLAQNLAREHFALGGGVALWDLPSFESARRNSVLLGLTDGHWLDFAADQLHRIGLALAPYVLTRFDIEWPGWTLLGALGLATVVAVAIALARRGERTAVLTLLPLALTGIAWAIGMRGAFWNYRHFSYDKPYILGGPQWSGGDIFEAMFLVGMPLALFALLGLLWAPPGWPRQRLVRGASAALVAAAAASFVVSALHMSRLHRDAEVAGLKQALLADFDANRRLAAGARVHPSHRLWIEGRRIDRSLKRLYFADHILVRSPEHLRFAEFVVAARIPGARTLTPTNRFLFLYGTEEYLKHCPKAGSCPPGPRNVFVLRTPALVP